MQLNEAIGNNLLWATKRAEEDPTFFERLARGQKPSILYIGCSDSRVAAEEMLGAGPGELFVHRNIANLIPNNDHSSNAVINFAVKDLGVKSVGRVTDLKLDIDRIVDSIRDIYSIAEKV